MALPPVPVWLAPWLPWAPVAAFGGLLLYGVATQPRAGGDDRLERGAWYRLRLRVDPDAPERFGSKDAVPAADVADALQRMGYPDIAYLQLANAYSPDINLVDAIARSTGEQYSSALLKVERRVRLDAADPLAAYPTFLEPYHDGPAVLPTALERRAVDHVATYGSAIEAADGARIVSPDLAPAARLLRARADVLRRTDLERRRAELGPLSAVPLVAGLRSQARYASSSQPLVGRAPRGSRVGITQGGFAALGLFGFAAIPFLSPNDLRDTVDGLTSAGRDLLSVVKTAAPFIQLGMSFVPGVGTVAAAAIGAGISLASGRRITDVFIDAAVGAMPGGALAQIAVRTSAKIVASIAYGDRIDAAFAEALRAGIPAEARAAFDMGLATVQGKRIQDLVEIGAASISQEAVVILRAARDGKLDADALAAIAVRATDANAKSALGVISDTVRAGRNLDDLQVLADMRNRFPREARASLEVAIAHLRRRDPFGEALRAARDMAPSEAVLAREMAARAMRDRLTSATLSQAAAGMAPLASGAIPGSVDDPRVRAAAESLAAQGPRVFARPQLWMNLDEYDPVDVKLEEERERAADQWAELFRLAAEGEEKRRIEAEYVRAEEDRRRVAREVEERSRVLRARVREDWARRWGRVAEGSQALWIPQV